MCSNVSLIRVHKEFKVTKDSTDKRGNLAERVVEALGVTMATKDQR